MSVTDTPQARQYRMNINGHRFAVSSDYPEEKIRAIEQFVNERVSSVSKQSEVYDQRTLGALVALNLADELIQNQNQNHLTPDTVDSIEGMCSKLETAVKNFDIRLEDSSN